MNIKLIRYCAWGIVLMSGLFPAVTHGESASDQLTPEQKIERYVNGNLFGIQNVKKDANKRVVSLVSIGRAPVSSALSKSMAKNQAIKRADAIARAEFMKWLTTSVTYSRVDQSDIAITQKGDTGAVQSSETAESTELTQEQIVTVASGLVKGMVQIGVGVNDDNEAVVILGWSAETAEATDDVRAVNAPDKSKDKSPRARGDETGKIDARPLEKKTTVSDSVGEYL